MEAAGLYGSEHAGLYDGTANYSIHSTVPRLYFGLSNWRAILQRHRGPESTQLFPSFEERVPAAVFIAKNCNGNFRNYVIRELSLRGVPIHSISDCAPGATLQRWPMSASRHDKLGALRAYRVYLAFENDVQDSYVTEKAIDGFAAGAVPLYLGAPNVADYVPADGFISAGAVVESDDEARASALDALAERVRRAIENKTEWQGYMAWREQPLERLNGGALWQRWSWTYGVDDVCRFCRFAYASLTPGASWDHDRQQIAGKSPPPRRGDRAAWAAWRQYTSSHRARVAASGA
uniref:Fucosyltransferase n=1 Tax=Alexandrium catenella TaxID=2925 RepID=A0A7S1RBQ0_ALECA